ncbi:MAG: hypothetical protein AB1757_04040 [Acidobacteriota bacterium]
MAEQRKSVEALLEDAKETIEGIIRKKFRVSLSPSDGRYENQNALELCQEVYTLLFERLVEQEHNPTAEPIRSIRDYAAVLTYHRCAELRRAQNKQWHSLKNKVRYFLGKRPEYAVWSNDTGEWLCGFVSQKNRPPSRELAVKLEALNQHTPTILPAHLISKDLRNLKDADWQELIETIFKHLDSAVEVDDIVSAIADIFGVQDDLPLSESAFDNEEPGRPPIDPKDEGLTPEETLSQRQFLEKLWQQIVELRPNQRIAYLLNFRDADGDIQLFTWNGIVSLEQIGALLNLTDEQFERAWQALPLDEATRALLRTTTEYHTKFAALFAHIPLEDLLIARMLGGERQQVINLRKCARERLAKYLRSFQ